jgi:hypothetical protein
MSDPESKRDQERIKLTNMILLERQLLIYALMNYLCNEVCSVENIAIVEVINDMDFLNIPKDYRHDFGDIDELPRLFQDICIKKKLDPGMLSMIEKYNLSESIKNAKCTSWLWQE